MPLWKKEKALATPILEIFLKFELIMCCYIPNFNARDSKSSNKPFRTIIL